MSVPGDHLAGRGTERPGAATRAVGADVAVLGHINVVDEDWLVGVGEFNGSFKAISSQAVFDEEGEGVGRLTGAEGL